MASLADILVHAKGIKDSLTAGEFVGAWEYTLPLQQVAIDGARAAGFKSSPQDAKLKQEITDCLCECESLCKSPPVSATPAVGKIGDGKILELILKLIMTLGPLFL